MAEHDKVRIRPLNKNSYYNLYRIKVFEAI